MFKAIGLNSQTVYASGETKADVMRFLQANYPSFSKKVGVNLRNIYPEPLRIVK